MTVVVDMGDKSLNRNISRYVHKNSKVFHYIIKALGEADL